MFDVTAFIKGMGIRDGEVVACGGINAGTATDGGGGGGGGLPSGEQVSVVFNKLAETVRGVYLFIYLFILKIFFIRFIY